MVVSDEQYVNEEDSTNAITIADTEQSIPIPIVEEPDMTTVLSENVPESSLPTTVPVATEPTLSNENNDTRSLIASNNAVNDTSVKVYTESEMEEERLKWQSKMKNQFEILNLAIKEECEQRESAHKNRITELCQKIETAELNDVRNMYIKSGKKNLEMLVITSLIDGKTKPRYNIKYYCFRRQLRDMLNAVNKKTNMSRGDRVELWFVTCNAVQDFINCKSYIEEKAQKNGIQMNTAGNDIRFEAGNDIRFDFNSTKFNTVVKWIRDFGKTEGMIELDKTFLQTVIEISQIHRRTDINRAKVEQLKIFVQEQSDEMLKDIYDHIMKNVM